MIQGNLIPIFQTLLLALDQFQLILRIINQGTKLLLLGFPERITENLVHLALYGTGSVSQHMAKGLILAMQITQEVLRTLR